MRIKAFLLFSILLITSFVKAQTANVTNGCAPLVVQFTAPAGHSTWYWDFGDGGVPSFLQNPQKSFVVGTYNVVFRATSGGPQIGPTIVINVYPLPTISFTASPPKGCTPDNVTFNATTNVNPAITITNYSWSFGDGQGTNAPTSTTIHTYNSPGGVFNVSLAIQTNLTGCGNSATLNKVVSCSAPPIANFTPSPNAACEPPLKVNFTNTSSSPSSLPLTYLWNLDPGTSILTTPPAQTYTVNGTTTVTLTATDSNNCSGSTVQTITVNGPHSSFTMPDTICINARTTNCCGTCITSPVPAPFCVNNFGTTITNTSSAGSYEWIFDSNASPTTSNATNPSVVYFTPGTHTVTLVTFAANGCSDTVAHTVYVQQPTATFTTTPTYICTYPPTGFNFVGSSPNTIKTWNWVFGDGTTKTGKNVSHTYSIVDSIYDARGGTVYTTSLTAVTAYGCVSAPFALTDTVYLPWARFMPDTTQGCAPLTVNFFDSSRFDPKKPIVSWKWKFGDGDSVIYSTPPAPPKPVPHTYTTPGTYTVTLTITNSLGCIDTSYNVIIRVGGPKAITFTATPSSVCPGDTIKFTNTTVGAGSFNAWNYSSNKEFLSSCYQYQNTNSFVFKDSVGPQIITLTGLYNGCPSTATTTITVNGPIAHFNYLMLCTSPNVVQFTDESLGATGLSWNFGDGSPTSSATGTFTHTYTVTGDYKVKLTATGVCAPSTDSTIIHIRNIKAKFTAKPFYCEGTDYVLNASASIDVFANCYMGYTWIYGKPNKRPVTYSTPITDTINFTTTGTQTIGLIVSDINGCADTLIDTIRVYEVFAKYSISDTSICFPTTVTFTDKTVPDTTLTGWKWNFGDGSSNSLVQAPPPHIYTSGTTFTTSLVVSDILGCKDSIKHVITTYKPTSIITTIPSPANICLGAPVVFNASQFTSQGSSLSYVWNFKNGTDTTGNGINYVYKSAGSYNVELKYTEISSGCNDSAFTTVNVQNYPVDSLSASKDNSVLGLVPPPSICYFDDIVTFTNSTAVGTYATTTWYLDNGSGITQNTPYTPAALPKGTHKIKMVVSTSYGCSRTDSATLYVVGPVGKITPTTVNICKGDSVTFNIIDSSGVVFYAFDFADGSKFAHKGPVVHRYDSLYSSGFVTPGLIMWGTDSTCKYEVFDTVYIHYVKAGFNIADSLLCLGQTATLTNASSPLANTFSWILGDGGTSASSTTVTHLYANSNTYKVQLIASNSTFGCIDTATKKIIIYALPPIAAVGDTVCFNSRAKLFVSNPNSNYTYLWKPYSQLTDSTASVTFINTATVSGTYQVMVTDTANNCKNTASAHLQVILPLTDINWDTSIVIGDIISLPITKQDSQEQFIWNPSTGLSCTNCPYPQVQPLQNITYNVTTKDTCSQAIGTFVITVKPEMFIDVPTTFTPNGDGKNDVIYVKGWGLKQLITFQIYNRWGELLFQTTDFSEGWDGYYQGVLQNNDTYVYKVVALTWRDTQVSKEGHFNLMR